MVNELPPIYIINLARSSERLENFERRNGHLAGVTRYPAVDGTEIDRRELVRDGTISEDCPYSAGSLGCSLSHVSLWRHACAEQRPLTIFEDDVVVSAGFEETTARLLSALPPTWDIVIWGYPIHERLPIWIDCGVGRARLNWYQRQEYENYSEFQGSSQNHVLFRLVNCWGAQAYSVSVTGARTLLNECLPLRKRVIQFAQPGVSFWDEAIDGPMNIAYPAMQSFVCIPPLVVHDEQVESDRKTIDRS